MAAISYQQYNPGSYGASASIQPQKLQATWKPSGNQGMYALAAQAMQTEGELESQRMLSAGGMATTALKGASDMYNMGLQQIGATGRNNVTAASGARIARENREAQKDMAKSAGGGLGGAIGNVLGGAAQVVGAFTQPKLSLAIGAAKALTS